MGYIFFATAAKENVPHATHTRVTVYQQLPGAEQVSVANILDSEDGFGIRETTITFAEGTLEYYQDIDAPIYPEENFPFMDKQNNRAPVCLRSDRSYAVNCPRFLSDSSGNYPVFKEYGIENNISRIAVYKASVSSDSDLRPDAVLAEIECTQKDNSGFTYEVRIEDFPSIPFLMAVFCLPFAMYYS